MQYSLHKGSIVKLRAKLMLQALVPAHPCKPRPFFFPSPFFPSTPSPFFLLQVNIWCPHAIPGESPPLVLSSAPWLPCGVTHTRLSWPYSHPLLLHTRKTDAQTSPPPPISSKVPICADSAPASFEGCCVLSLLFSDGQIVDKAD